MTIFNSVNILYIIQTIKFYDRKLMFQVLVHLLYVTILLCMKDLIFYYHQNQNLIVILFRDNLQCEIL